MLVAYFLLCQGYALVEYKEKEHAEKAIRDLNGQDLLGQKVNVDWAFVQGMSPGLDAKGGLCDA